MWRLYTPPSLIPNSGSGINTLNVVRKPCDSSFQIECFSREGVPPKDVVPSKERSVSLECHRRKGVTPKVLYVCLWGTPVCGGPCGGPPEKEREGFTPPSLSAVRAVVRRRFNAFIYAINWVSLGFLTTHKLLAFMLPFLFKCSYA